MPDESKAPWTPPPVGSHVFIDGMRCEVIWTNGLNQSAARFPGSSDVPLFPGGEGHLWHRDEESAS